MSNFQENSQVDSSAGNISADGGSLTVEEAIANLKQREDPSLRYYAAWWLGRFRVNEPAAIEGLLEALQDETDRAPDGGYPLRRNAAKALGKLGERRVVPALIECLKCPDYYVRESAAQALEMLGDNRAISALIPLLDGGVQAAQKVPGKPHLTQPYEAILEALGTLGAVEAASIIEPFLDHFTEKVQYAAARAMYQLTNNSIYGERLVQALEGNDLQLRRSALMDLGAIGYLGAAEAIAETLAENSLKIISLKGLLEHHLENSSLEEGLSQESLRIMKLMDQLL
ncbi:PBS lyase HEAT domain protein repeat-containing protein [Gloeothece citriformis PCC 7424]|uniref:PBS lyase HEAT domain protein repeat-containing protein n=1 Tax=Gloeothece citriformis (strain PCC 7424) TaxID=65393 RepID=B7K9E3_GLOC7|nr:HEAT repeat domain-containing protein [Gloeothece citriformis]ACK68626.1 PBS lyase HEAT domain protein repeat-containing protein [Gloeothece citriformis PCC 7424]